MAPVDTTSERVSWYLVQIKPNSYRIAERALQRQGYSVFCPLLEISQVRAGRSSLVKKPLFPGYLFVAFDPLDAPWRAINSTHGVSRLVTFGENYPPAVPNALVVSLMSRCDEEGKLLPVESLQPGDLVQINSGPFAQLVTRIECIGADQRVYTLLDILGRPTRVGLRAEAIDKLD